MNKILSEAGYQEHELRWNFMQAKKHPGQLSLFDMPVPPPQTVPRPSKEAVAEHILRLLQRNALKRRDIYAGLADESYFADEIDKALTLLKRQKKISYHGELTNNTLIRREHS
jgi:hypothetical protein